MYWTDLYAAMVEEEADQLAEDRRRRQMLRPAAAPSPTQIELAGQLRALGRENLRLKGAFASLVQVLMQKRVVDEQDVRQVIEDARRLQ